MWARRQGELRPRLARIGKAGGDILVADRGFRDGRGDDQGESGGWGHEDESSVSFFGMPGPRTPGPGGSARRLGSTCSAAANHKPWLRGPDGTGGLARMPAGQDRDELIRRLQSREDPQVSAALAELVTFILLDSVYPVVELQPTAGPASHTDFAVTVPSTHFEVHRTLAPEADRKDAQRRRSSPLS